MYGHDLEAEDGPLPARLDFLSGLLRSLPTKRCAMHVSAKVWDLTANKFHEVMTLDGQSLPIRSLSMATNASVLVGANSKGTVFVFTPGGDTKVMKVSVDGNPAWRDPRRVSTVRHV